MSKRILYIGTAHEDYYRVKSIGKIIQNNFTDSVLITSNKSNYFFRLLDVIIKFIPHIYKINKHFDVIIMGFLCQPIFPFVKLFWKNEIISDFFISLFDTIVLDRKLYSKKHLIAKLAYYFDSFTLDNSTLIITDTTSNSNFYQNLFNIPKKKFVTLHIGADQSFFNPTPFPSFDGKLVVTFHGTYIPLQGIPIILKAISLVEQQTNDVSFNIIGKGQEFQECLNLSETLKLKHVRFFGMVSKKKLASIYRKTHIGLGIFSSKPKAFRVIPNKVYDILSLKRVLITSRSPEIDAKLKHHFDCFLVEPNSPEALASQIVYAYKHPNVLASIAQNGNKTFEKHWDINIISNKFIKIINKHS